MNNTATNTATCPTVRKQIGKTTYIVRVHFSQTAKETMEDKIKRLLREEVRKMWLLFGFDEKVLDFSSLAKPQKAFWFPAELVWLRLPHHVRVLWDEAANTGQVPNLEKLVAVIRSREVSLCLFYQQLAQCKAIYDKHAETILGNMDSVIFLGGREASTIKEISENWLGKATISMQTEGRSRGQSESYNQNTQRLGRELMTPSELATMPGDKCILQLRGLPPFFSPKYDLKQHPNYKQTAEADKKKNAFDLDKLINRRRRPGLNEACEVYKVAVSETSLTDEDEDILNYDDVDDPDAFV